MIYEKIKTYGNVFNSTICQKMYKLEQLERLRSKDTPAASWLPTLLSHIGSQVKITIDLELKTLQSGHDFQSQGRMTLKI